MALAASAAEAPDGGDVHDGAALFPQHRGQRPLTAVIDAPDVDGEHPLPVLRPAVLKQADLLNAGVVDEDGYLPERRFHDIEHRVHGYSVRDVGLHGGTAAFRGDGLGLFPAGLVIHRDGVSLRRKLPADGGSDAATPAGDEHDLCQNASAAFL